MKSRVTGPMRYGPRFACGAKEPTPLKRPSCLRGGVGDAARRTAKTNNYATFFGR